MIFLDTSVLLRVLTAPATPQDRVRRAQAIALISQAHVGDVLLTFSEVVLHEVSYVLTSPRQYGFTPAQAIPLVRSILEIQGVVLPENEREIFHLALDLWEQYPKLEFSDAVIAARSQQDECDLASFDRHFDAIPSLSRWVPNQLSE